MSRPFSVWIIAAWYFFSCLMFVFGLYVTYVGIAQLGRPVAQFNAVDWVIPSGILVLNLVGATLLIMKKKSAFPLLCIPVVIGPLLTAWNLIMGMTLRVSNIGALLGWLIGLYICKYVWDLKKSGYLA